MKRATIKSQVHMLAHQYSSKVMLATETGSRRWGFESEDSDYDVRFIFRRAEEHVFSLWPKNDTLTRSMTIRDEILDMHGWELGKTLMLMYKGNTQAFEWLTYPNPYIDEEETKYVRDLMLQTWNPKTAIEHYLGIARGNWYKYIVGSDTPAQKRYLYVIRGIVNARWVAQYGTIPPADLPFTLTQVKGLPRTFCDTAEDLFAKKRARELNSVGRIAAIDQMGLSRPDVGDLFTCDHKPQAIIPRNEIDFLWRMITKCEWPE